MVVMIVVIIKIMTTMRVILLVMLLVLTYMNASSMIHLIDIVISDNSCFNCVDHGVMFSRRSPLSWSDIQWSDIQWSDIQWSDFDLTFNYVSFYRYRIVVT